MPEQSAPPGNGVGTVETRGIEPVRDADRGGRARQMFWTWFAANIGILGLPLGATLVVFKGLNIWQAAIAAVVGSVGSFALVGALSIAGKRGGAPGLTLSRAPFGVRGNAGPTLIAWISRVGWETITTTTAAYALLSLLHEAFGIAQNTVLTIVCLLVFIVLTLLISGLGYATIMWVNRWATYVFGILNLVVMGFLVATVDWSTVLSAPAGSSFAVVGGIGTIAAGTGIGWANAGADYARYLPRKLPAHRLVFASAFGAGIPLILLICLGSLLSSGDSTLASASNPVAAVNAMLPPWMSVPYLIAAVGGLLLSNHLSVYSAGLTMLTLGIRVRRIFAVSGDVVLTFVGGIYFMLIAPGFYGPFNTFLTLLAVPITAWVGVFGVDVLRRRGYQHQGLMDTRSTSRYWYRAGICWQALLSWLLAIVIGMLFTEASTGPHDVWFAGPWAHSWIGAHGLGWVVTFLVAAALYGLLSHTGHSRLVLGRDAVTEGGTRSAAEDDQAAVAAAETTSGTTT